MTISKFMESAMDREQFMPFADGLPVRPDVDLLIATWPKPQVGDRFEYDSIERLLSIKRASARFRTVTKAWRKRLKDTCGLILYAESDTAFYCANADQVIGRTYSTLSEAARKLKRHRSNLLTVKHDRDDQRVTIEHQARLILAVERDAKKQRMNLLPSTAVPEAPRIQPPTKAVG